MTTHPLPMTAYEIKTGNHYPTPKFWRLPHTGIKALEGVASFGSSCWYDRKVIGGHINKLVGFTTDLLKVNSIRIGWRPHTLDGLIELYLYKHQGGSWIRQPRLADDMIAIMPVNHVFSWSIWLDSANKEVNVTCGTDSIESNYSGCCGPGYYMGPYFGGVPTAPQTMIINLGV